MNRGDLQELSNLRIREARVLLKAGQYSGAYYLAGYSVECALKACFAKGVKRFDFPDRNGAGKIFTHRLTELAKLANLDAELGLGFVASPRFQANWIQACSWTEESRYSVWKRNDAEEMVDVITNRNDGVLPWIKRRW
jgi:HEPN domain-containing protein